jgi:hypothetical protein
MSRAIEFVTRMGRRMGNRFNNTNAHVVLKVVGKGQCHVHTVFTD